MNDGTPVRPTRNVELGASGEEFQNLHEFIRRARSRLNQNAWDYIVGAAETETTMPHISIFSGERPMTAYLISLTLVGLVVIAVSEEFS